ncbi:MAG TPA: HesA/MoeB/ThiF family protein [Flavobacteriales bacterium]|nr:HesA/MoeB/ThiF family protein [Flavobacteriales bacterium]
MASNFTKEELIRYNRQMMLPGIGMQGQEKIKAAKVLVTGAGGLGCPVLQYLCVAGIGTIGIVDFDVVELHNLHRQILYTAADLGKPKALIAAEALKKLNPYVQFRIFNEMLNETNAETIIKEFDVVVDGSDNFLTRYTVNDACVKLNVPIVYGSILGFEGQFAVFNYKNGKNLRDLFPEPPNAEDVPNCDENGVLGTLPGIIASMMAHETLKLVIGIAVSKKLVIFDTANWNFTAVE